MKWSCNENILFYAKASTPIVGLYRHRRKLKFWYFAVFLLTLLIHLAYILGLWLQLAADGTPAAQDNLWFCLVFTVALLAGAVCVAANKTAAGLAVNGLSATVLLVGVWGNLAFVGDTVGIKVAKGILYLAPVTLVAMVALCGLYYAALAGHKARVQKQYDRIVSAVYQKATRDAGGTPSRAELQAALEAYTGQDPSLYGKQKLSRSEKARLRKQ